MSLGEAIASPYLTVASGLDQFGLYTIPSDLSDNETAKSCTTVGNELRILYTKFSCQFFEI